MLHITIREREHKNSTTLYLDYYKDNKRIVKSLGITFNPNNRIEKETAYFQANLVKNKIIEDDLKDSIKFADFDTQYNPNHYEPNTIRTREKHLKSVLSYDPYATLHRIDRQWLSGFIAFLEKQKLKSSSINSKVAYVKSVLHIAQRNELLDSVPDLNGLTPKINEANREFLTMEEIKLIDEAKVRGHFCKELKRAFLFACFTGLRLSDVRRLKYEDIRNGILRMTMKKTKQEVVIPLTKNALKYLDPKGKGIVFSINYKAITSDTTRICNSLKRICFYAGVDKHITFHCARHTFAVNALKFGGDVFVVSKLLGHTKIETTQKYLHCLTEDKQRILDLVPTL